MTQRVESDAIGYYANFLIVGHNAFEFVLEFGQHYEGDDASQMHTRIVTAPVYAKSMLETLRAAIERFEAAYGAIPNVKEEAARIQNP